MKLLVRRADTGYLDTDLWVPKTAVNVEGVKRALSFTTFDQQGVRVIALYRESDAHIIVPREFWQPADFQFPVVDLRPERFPHVIIRSKVVLDHVYNKENVLVPTGEKVQQEAIQALLRSRGGVLQLACGKGKTVVALEYAARKAVPTLIIVDTTQLLIQWQEEISRFLDVPDGIGLIQGDVADWQKPVVMTTYKTLAMRAPSLPEEVRRWFGTIIWDECHHVPAPMFSRTANLFYGTRIGLTATPTREDGLHVIMQHHIGQVLYKNLSQELKPHFYFVSTGMKLDPTDLVMKQATHDRNGELHIIKLASFLGSWPARLLFVISQVRRAVADGRKVLVLSKSVDALVNMLAVWNNYQKLITDIPFPSEQEVGEVTPSISLDEHAFAQLQKKIYASKRRIEELQSQSSPTSQKKLQEETVRKQVLEQTFEGYRVFKKCEALWDKKRADFIKDVLEHSPTAGLMIHRIKPAVRSQLLREKQVTFAIMKYGREGLNEKSLDTFFAHEPISSRNTLQQLMGRLLRRKEGKRDPIGVFFEDDIGPFIGMCQKLRKYLREWPADEGGPLSYDRTLPQFGSTTENKP